MRRWRWLAGIVLVTAVATYVNPSLLLYPAGRYLIQAEEPAKSDCIVVLAGDFFGQRIQRAAELYRQGYAPKVLISGPAGIFLHSEDELAIEFARKNGAGDVPFTGVPIRARSTESEGQALLPHLSASGCKSVMVVTSDFHTRRAGRILRRVWPGIEVRVAAAPSYDYDAARWWTDRNYQKTFFFEWAKTLAEWLGL